MFAFVAKDNMILSCMRFSFKTICFVSTQTDNLMLFDMISGGTSEDLNGLIVKGDHNDQLVNWQTQWRASACGFYQDQSDPSYRQVYLYLMSIDYVEAWFLWDPNEDHYRYCLATYMDPDPLVSWQLTYNPQ